MPRPTLYGLLVPALIVCAALPVRAGVTAGDTCESALVVPSLPYDSGLLDIASFSNGAPAGICDPNDPPGMSQDLWFKWVATESGGIIVELETDVYDGIFQVHSGASCASLFLEACASGEVPGLVSLSFAATAGQTYYIQAGRVGFVGGPGLARITLKEPPPNDECDGAFPLPVESTVIVDTRLATTSPSDPPLSCLGGAPGSRTLWYSFVAPAETMVVTTADPFAVEGQGNNSVLALYSGQCGALTEIACSDDVPCCPASTLASITATGLTPGATYLVQISSRNPGAGDTFPLRLVVPLPCSPGAIAETEPCGTSSNGGCVSFDFAAQPVTLGVPVCGTAWADNGMSDADFYRFEIDTDRRVRVSLRSRRTFIVTLRSTNCIGSPQTYLQFTAECDGSECASFASVDLPPGQYAVRIGAPLVFLQNAVPYYCANGQNGYELTVSAGPPGCPGDSDGNLIVDFNDIVTTLGNWLNDCR